MASIDDDYSWTPPSEAELKVIEARRERNNKISSLMGQYLLKGFKMLAVTCPVCDCVLLEDRNKSKYCIGCCEVDADTKKDNPAVSEEAARKAVEEIQHRQQPQDKPSEPCYFTNGPSNLVNRPSNLDNGYSNLTSNEPSNLTNGPSNLANGHGTNTSTTAPKHTQGSRQSKSLSIHGVDLTEDVVSATSALRDKLAWAGNQLQATNSVHDARSLAELINESCKAITALRDL